jgi:hypothetical protein
MLTSIRIPICCGILKLPKFLLKYCIAVGLFLQTIPNLDLNANIANLSSVGTHVRSIPTDYQIPVGNPFFGSTSISNRNLSAPNFSQPVGHGLLLQHARESIRSYRHAGKPMLENMFKNFGPGREINLDDPGVWRQIHRLGVDNKNVAMGAAREMVYYQEIYNQNTLFQDVRLSVEISTASGARSDMDIFYRERFTGRSVWVEVKDYDNHTLRLNPRLQAQIERMGQFDGKSVLVCRGKVASEVKMFAARNGVIVHDQINSADLARILAHEQLLHARIQSGISITSGAIFSLVGTLNALSRLFEDSFEIDKDGYSALASDTLLSGTGTSFLARGILLSHEARLATNSIGIDSLNPRVSLTKSRVDLANNWQRNLGRAGWVFSAGFAVHEGYRIYEKDIDLRSGVSNLTGLGTAAALGIAGAKGGAIIGAIAGPLAPITSPAGAILGGIVGSYVGYFGGSSAANTAYDHFIFNNSDLAREKLIILERSL